MTTPSPTRRVVLITGASAGLGAATALELARGGHRLALVARRAAELEAVAAQARALGAEAVALPSDLADPETPARLVSRVIEEFGRLDALINNAGIGLPDLGRAGGTVINIGSAITTVANPVFGAYGASKAALSYWSDALRRELKYHGVRVCYVDLGPVGTEFFEAVRRLDGGEHALGIGPPTDALYNAVRDRPPALMTIKVEHAARRVARLLDRPRRRLALPRRVVWPMRVFSAVFALAPGLGDLAVSAMIRRVDRERGRSLP